MQTTLFAAGFTWPESPRWHRGALYLSDVYNFRIAKVCPGEAPITVATLPGRPAGLGFFPDGRLLAAGAHDHKLWWIRPDGEPELALDLSGKVAGNLNDMVVDETGRVWVGATGFDPEKGEQEHPGTLFCWTPGMEPVIAATDVRFPNGLAVAPDGKTLYLNETFASHITAFDIGSDGKLGNRRVHARLPNGPDGLCMDAEGSLWVAILFDRTFLRIATDGSVQEKIVFDRELAVSCVFGGEDRKTLYLAVSEHDFGNPASVPLGTVRAAVPRIAGAGTP